MVLPNDASNTGRALLLLQAAGLITLTDPQNPLQIVRDIATNPKGLKFQEVEAATIPRILPQVDGAVINTNYALDAGLKPYDFAPFAPVVEGAGGIVTDWQGRPLTLDSGPCILAAGDPVLHAAALDLAIASYRKRERRFGRTSEQVQQAALGSGKHA